MKHCCRCDRSLSESAFNKNSKTASGLSSYCKPCAAAYRKDNLKRDRARLRRWRSSNPAMALAQNKRAARARKQRVVNAYGGKCACCGDTNWEFLCLDHIDGNGNNHRRSIKLHGGGGFYDWLGKHGYPKDIIRLLCYNCNCSLAYYGYCPHGNVTGPAHWEVKKNLAEARKHF